MELTHENIQALHEHVRKWKVKKVSTENPEKNRVTARDGQEYEIINTENYVTEAIAVAPIVDEKTDYSNTIILTAGTQDKFIPFKNSQEEIGKTAMSAVGAAEQAYLGGLSPQYVTMDRFFTDTQRIIKEKGGEDGKIKYSSAHSQAGVPNAKLSVKYKVDEIVNFYDWGAQNAVNNGKITPSEMAYLNNHAVIYSDSGKALTEMDGNGGAIPYGQVRVYEGKSHDIQTPVLKGKNLDINWYYKRNLFAAGMTEKQVRKIAKAKAEKAKDFNLFDSDTWNDSTDPEYYVKEYKELYGDFAPEPTRLQLIALNNQRIQEIQASMAGATGAGLISLREELVRAAAQNAQLQAEEYGEAIRAKMAEARESVQNHISELRSAAHTLAHNLSDGEVEDLLSELSFEVCWNRWTEEGTLGSASLYQTRLTDMAGKLNAAADKLLEADQKGAGLFATE